MGGRVQKWKRRATARRGFTLVETVLALSIMSIGVLGLGAMQLMTMQYGNRGRYATDAANIAQTQIEQLQRVSWTDASIAPTAGWTAPVTVNTVVQDASGNSAAQSFSMSYRVANAVAGLTRTVDVRIQWDEPDRANRSFALSTLRFNLEGL